MINADLFEHAKRLSVLLLHNNINIVTAESCTGGGLAALFTEIPGSSQWFERGFVTYSNESKMELLNVQEKSLLRFGAVSEEVAREMAQGALVNSHADISVSITGIAGPGGGTDEKPVGTVHIATSFDIDKQINRKFLFDGSRTAIRYYSSLEAIELLTQSINLLANKYKKND